MDEWDPTSECDLFLHPQLLDCQMQCKSGFGDINVVFRCLAVLEEMAIKDICHIWCVFIIYRPKEIYQVRLLT